MRIQSLTILFFLLMIAISCKNNSQNASATDESVSSETIDQSGEGFMKDGPVGDQDHNWTFLTNQLFHYAAGFRVGQKQGEKPFEGHWIDLSYDGTFEKGIYNKTSYAGEWTYDHDKTLLTLFPDPDDEKNSQWRVMANDDMVVLVGTATYQDNATQVQLVRRTEKPKK